MKKALLVIAALVVLFIIVPLVAGAIGEQAVNFMAIVYAAAVFALPVVLVVLLVRHLRKKKAASATKKAAQETAPQPPKPVVTVTKAAKVPPMAPADTRHDVAAGNGIAHHYAGVGIYVPFIDVLERPDVVPGAIVTFRQEPENRFDNRAVAVVIGRKRIGYLYRGKLQDMANDWIERGDTVSGRIVRVSPDVSDARKNAIKIDLYFYE